MIFDQQDKKSEIMDKPDHQNDNVSANENVSNTEQRNDSLEKEQSIKDGTDIFDEGDNLEISAGEEKGAAEKKEPAKNEAKGEKKSSKVKKKKKKKELRRIATGRAYIQASYNNTIITLTDQAGNTLVTGSAGQLGFKGPKKSTPYAASIVIRDMMNRIKDVGLQNVAVFVKGVGAGREAAVRALNANGLNILAIKDETPIPHNGCRPKKPRRV